MSKEMNLKCVQLIDYFLNGVCFDVLASIVALLSVSFFTILRVFVNMVLSD